MSSSFLKNGHTAWFDSKTLKLEQIESIVPVNKEAGTVIWNFINSFS